MPAMQKMRWPTSGQNQRESRQRQYFAVHLAARRRRPALRRDFLSACLKRGLHAKHFCAVWLWFVCGRRAGGRSRRRATECLCVCGDGRTTTNQRARLLEYTRHLKTFQRFRWVLPTLTPAPRSASAPCELDGADIVAARTTHSGTGCLDVAFLRSSRARSKHE